MSIKKGLIIPFIAMLLAGCMQDNAGQTTEQQDNDTQPIKYETQQDQKRPGLDDDTRKTRPDNKYKHVNEGDGQGQTDKFTNDVSQSISDELKQRHDVRQAQVAVADDKVIVGVMLTDQAPPDMRELVEEKVQEMAPNRDVQVYTDDIYWDRMRNKDAQLDQLNGDMREYFREFFTQDREHF